MIIISEDHEFIDAMSLSKPIIPLNAFTLLAAAPLRGERPSLTLSIRDHRFKPETLEIPAGQKIRIIAR
jgi:hypothetical protein